MRTIVALFIAMGVALGQSTSRKDIEAQLEAIQAQEASWQAKLEQLRARYKDSYPDVKFAKSELERLKRSELLYSKLGGFNGRRQPDAATSSAAGQPLPDRWWRSPETAQAVGLTADQQKKMDDVFQQYRLRLVDLNAALEREEITLEPMLSAAPLDDAKIKTQIDRVAEARAGLEKAKGRMLLGIRELLTPDQWTKLSQNYSAAPAVK